MNNDNSNKQDFLFELGCEELPAKALIKMTHSMHHFIREGLTQLGLNFEESEAFATPRRMAVRFSGLDIAQQDKKVEKLGPAVAAAFDDGGQAKPAAMGFARSNGVSVEDLSRKVTDKGERLAYVAEVKGELTANLLPELIQKTIAQLPVPKAMRWGNSSFQFSRPVHWIVALLGDQSLKLSMFGVDASNLTYGHRFHAPNAIVIECAAQYEALLKKNYVIACFEERKANIRLQVEEIAKQNQAEAIIEEDLLEEVTALVEWPKALLGGFDEEFLQVPSEALVSSMAEHQKYFHMVNNKNELLANFITVANISSSNPTMVIEGNEKVIRPRLADAKFFYDTDCKNRLDSNVDKLKKIVFQNKLGSIYDKTQRVKTLAINIATDLEKPTELVARAADISKCDLVTNMVGEFSDLQGIMGRYYANNDGENEEVVAAMDEIYMPRFAGDQLPNSDTGLILALAERVDTLVGIFGIGQIPTGAKDPFALRRASLGVLRLISEKQLNLDLEKLIERSISTFDKIEIEQSTLKELLKFFAARTSAMYQEKGIPTNVIKAVQAVNVVNPTDFENRLNAVQIFDGQVESQDLAEANKRVKNILAKSDIDLSNHKINTNLFEQDERDLFETIQKVKSYVDSEIASANYGNALTKLAALKDVVNRFFDNVMINVDDIEVQKNRLTLITQLRNLFIGIADISLLQK
jgi:glycyl-tRNA synthetase beta chain